MRIGCIYGRVVGSAIRVGVIRAENSVSHTNRASFIEIIQNVGSRFRDLPLWPKGQVAESCNQGSTVLTSDLQFLTVSSKRTEEDSNDGAHPAQPKRRL